jgi:hypothetical protein
MSGADQPQDLRCPCTKKFAEVTPKGIVILCRGCGKPRVIPFGEVRGQEHLLSYLSKLPPRKLRLARRRRK